MLTNTGQATAAAAQWVTAARPKVPGNARSVVRSLHDFMTIVRMRPPAAPTSRWPKKRCCVTAGESERGGNHKPDWDLDKLRDT